jgi:hypothetical protein
VKRLELEHLIRAAGAITESNELVIVGSQAILGQFPDAPKECLISIEADIYPMHDPEKSILIDGAIGERSMFHETFGYYAHGVSADTAVLPTGYKDRLIPIRNDNTHNVTGWCLEVHDLAASKLAAGREKDMEFVAVLLRERLVDVNTLQQRVISLRDKTDLAEQRLGSAILKEYSARVQTPEDRVRLETENPGLVNLRDLYYGACKSERLTQQLAGEQPERQQGRS